MASLTLRNIDESLKASLLSSALLKTADPWKKKPGRFSNIFSSEKKVMPEPGNRPARSTYRVTAFGN
ncbi:MAG: hypothetical protein U5L07_02655 [Desulfobacterales bacterium]|nr:hypothetical protein [Desulfobacterales bacterium]